MATAATINNVSFQVDLSKIPTVTSPEYDEKRELFLHDNASKEVQAYLQKTLNSSSKMCHPETLQYDVKALAELNTLGFVTSGSQPGIVDRYEAQRAFVEGYMMPDEAAELYDLVNRTDIFCYTTAVRTTTSVRIPVTYAYTNMDNDIQSFAGNSPKWPPKVKGDESYAFPASTALCLITNYDEDKNVMVADKLNKWISYLSYVVVIDMKFNRLACNYMYPQILLPIMKAIRKRHPANIVNLYGGVNAIRKKSRKIINQVKLEIGLNKLSLIDANEKNDINNSKI